ncbi:MAG: hypothetical protein IIB19_02730, partial [Chloroflexi bacterium]|nr:hypothetical protein [Chloroflexota bacterium]
RWRGARVAQAQVTIPIVVRAPKEQFAEALTGETLGEVRRQGKYLLFPFRSGRLMVVHAMLTGRFQYCDPGKKRRARTAESCVAAEGVPAGTVGSKPMVDLEAQVLREGYIVSP